MIPREDCLLLGKITKKWGFEGALLVRLTHQENLKNKIPESVFIDIQGKLVPFFIVNSREHPPTGLIVRLSDTSETVLQRLLQCNVYVKDTQWIEQQVDARTIEGYEVIDKTFGSIGVVCEILEREIQPLMVVINDKREEILIPFDEEIILKTDHRRRRVMIQAPDGLIDLYLNP
jgi:16S rRNA processing protein RimM